MRNRPFITLTVEPCPKEERLRRWSLLAIIAGLSLTLGLLGFLATAHARGMHRHGGGYEYRSSCGASGCNSYFGPRTFDGGAHVYRVEPNPGYDEAADRKWVAYCKPVLTHDELGVGRYVYAHEGCGFGLTGPAKTDN